MVGFVYAWRRLLGFAMALVAFLFVGFFEGLGAPAMNIGILRVEFVLRVSKIRISSAVKSSHSCPSPRVFKVCRIE
jgi:hypothetical protein